MPFGTASTAPARIMANRIHHSGSTHNVWRRKMKLFDIENKIDLLMSYNFIY
jgi:hypothetical protein